MGKSLSGELSCTRQVLFLVFLSNKAVSKLCLLLRKEFVHKGANSFFQELNQFRREAEIKMTVTSPESVPVHLILRCLLKNFHPNN